MSIETMEEIGVVLVAGEDRFVRPKEAAIITGRSIASQYRDRITGKWPPMYRLGDNAVANRLSDLLALNASREIVTAENTRPVAPGAKRGRKPRNLSSVEG